MLRMIFIQLWNERKTNVLIYLELAIVSVFLWYAADALLVNYKSYSRPLGFDISHVYYVELATVPQIVLIMIRQPCITSVAEPIS